MIVLNFPVCKTFIFLEESVGILYTMEVREGLSDIKKKQSILQKKLSLF
jgi:hypothetical protein